MAPAAHTRAPHRGAGRALDLWDALARWLLGARGEPRTPLEINLAIAEEALEIAKGLADNTTEHNQAILARVAELVLLDTPSDLRLDVPMSP